MATGGEDGHVNLWAVGNPSYIMKFTGHSSSVESLSFNGIEELVCAGSRSGQLRIWNLGEGKVMRNLTGHKAAVSCLDFHSIGEFVASGSLDHKVKMWDYRRKGCIFTYTGHEGAINALQFSPDGRWMTSGSDDNTCRIWDLTAGKLLHQFKDHNAAVTCLQFHPNELLLATGSKDKTVKIYDVEQFQLVSSSRSQASAVVKVAFSESGHCAYSVSHDMCHAYLWEPEPRATDSVIVKWGQPTDIVISGKQLISASISKNIVTNYVVDLNLVRTSIFEVPDKPQPFRPPSPTAALPRQAAHITERPLTSCGAAVSTADIVHHSRNHQAPAPVHVNSNNNMARVEDDPVELPNDPEEVFRPKATLSRSPSGGKPTSLPVNKERERDRNIKVTPSPHQATNILPHLLEDPVVPKREKPERDFDSSKTVLKNDTPGESNRKSPLEDVPTRDENIPERLEEKHKDPADMSLPDISALTLNETRLSTIVPAQREDPVGLDMNAFLPAKKDAGAGNGLPAKKDGALTDAQAQAKIQRGFESMRIVLTARYKNLELVRALWSSEDVMTSMNAAVRMKDQPLLVDLLTVLNLKSSLWTLDLCQIMLPEICELLTSKYESYVSAACSALKVVLRTFGPVIKSNVSAPPTAAVDLSREERYKKCKTCHNSLIQIRTVVEKHLQKTGKAGSQFRELNLLMNTLD